ncbi:MAG: hypothetical protein M3Q36_00520 [bacterium]|nr:hypothetical protein [bacterium]
MDKQAVMARLKDLQPGYRANPQVLAQLSHINILAVIGPTGAGKSTIVRQSGLPFVIGDTTRAPREGEVQGKDYNFRIDFENMVREIDDGEFVQYVIQRDIDIYGTRSSSYPASGVCVMSILATALVDFRNIGFNSLRPIYIVPPNHSEWMRRISAHRDKDLEARLLEAKESLMAALNDPSYVFIINDNLETAISVLQGVARGSVDMNESSRARTSASTLFEHLQRVIR